MRLIRSINFIFACASVLVGFMFFKGCPKQPKLPIWLLVDGTMALIIMALQQSGLMAGLGQENKLRFFLNLFQLVWFILGNYWLFWMGDSKGCNAMVYYLAYAEILLIYLLAILWIFATCLARMRRSQAGATYGEG